MCGILLENLGLTNLTDYTVSKASLVFVSPYLMTDSFYKVYNLQSINAPTNAFSALPSDVVGAMKTDYVGGYYFYTANITPFVQKWTDFSGDYKNGL